jgi:salicylate hydroxylase
MTFSIPWENIAQDHELLELFEDEYLNWWMGPDTYVLSVPMPGNVCDMIVFLGQGESTQTDNLDIQQRLADFDSRIHKIISKALTSELWGVAQILHLPTWRSRSSRILLIGDAAHAMGPQIGQVIGVSSQIDPLFIHD